jgi:hypothetical protein
MANGAKLGNDTSWASIFAAVQLPRNDLPRLIAGEPSVSKLLAHANLTSTVSKYPCIEDEECCLRSPQRMPSGLKSVNSVVEAHNVLMAPYLSPNVKKCDSCRTIKWV